MDHGSGRVLTRMRVALVLLIAVLTACVSPETSGSPLPSGSSAANGAPWPTPELDAFDPGRFGWRAVGVELDDATSEPIRHWLYVGTLDSEEATRRIPLVGSPWDFALFSNQSPVVAGPVHGQVLYVADDGASSDLRVASSDGSKDESVGRTDDVVFSAALAPDAAAAFLVLLDRVTGQDRGAYRLTLDGSGALERVMEPAPRDRVSAGHGNVLAASQRFVRDLWVSTDGSQLARLACGEPFGTCLLEMLDLASGTQMTFGDPAIVELLGIGGGMVAGRFNCALALCAGLVEVVDLSGDGRQPLDEEWASSVTGAEGGLVLLREIGGTYYDPPAAELWGYDVPTGATRLLLAMDGGFGLGVEYPESQAVELPRGWALIRACPTTNPCARIALNLSVGEQVPVHYSEPPVIGGGHD